MIKEFLRQPLSTLKLTPWVQLQKFLAVIGKGNYAVADIGSDVHRREGAHSKSKMGFIYPGFYHLGQNRTLFPPFMPYLGLYPNP